MQAKTECNMELETAILDDDVDANDLNKTMPTFKFKNLWPNLQKLFCVQSNAT